jgi:GntR family transcriptional repressor for pyruvate dehydrogenase complex
MTEPSATGVLQRSARPRESAPEWVRNEILQWIERGDYQPGDALPSERELQAMFGVSRVVIREAIVRLQAVGLVTVEHGRGCSVSATVPDLLRGPFRVWMDLNAGEVVALLKVRRAMDGLAAEEAATAAGPEAVEKIADAERAFADAVESAAEPVRLVSLDKQLHVAIATASGLSIVAHLLTDLDHHSANLHRTSMAVSGRPAVSVRDHRAIVAAIAGRNPARARRAAERHVESSITQVRSMLADHAGSSTN